MTGSASVRLAGVLGGRCPGGSGEWSTWEVGSQSSLEVGSRCCPSGSHRQTNLKATGWQEELHTTLILNDHTQGWELENSELGVGPLAISDWVQVYTLSLPSALCILSYMCTHGGLSCFFIHLTALRPPQHFCTEWILNLFMQVLCGLWRKLRSLYFWSSRRKKQKTTQQSDTAWIPSRSRHSVTSWGHFHPLMLRLDWGGSKGRVLR